MPDFGIFRGFNEKLFGDKLVAGQLPTKLGMVADDFGQLLLDFYPNAAAAYSLRKLRAGYTGSAIKVRRAVGTPAETDIGFVDGELDTTSLESFCSGTNGFVTTWYDQSGNGNDATQTTAANQPQIVSSGSVILENGKPSLQFDGSNDYLNYVGAIGISGSQNRSIFTTIKLDNNNNIPIISHGEFTGGNNRQVYSLTAELAIRIFGGNIIFGITDTSQMLIYNYLDGDSTFDISMYKDGSNLTYTSRGTDNLIETDDTEIDIMAKPLDNKYLSGRLQELVYYPSDQSTNRTGIETNINDFYSIY